MHGSLARSASVAATCILTLALLVGCASSGSVPGATSRVSQTSVFSSVDLGAPPKSAGPIGNETMTGRHISVPCGSFNVTGPAQGPYPGHFQASGKWTIHQVGKLPFLNSFSESFTMTSDSKTITGSFIWNGGNVIAGCDDGAGGIARSTNFTYTATLMRGGKVIKQFAGSASESGIDGYKDMKSFGETLI